VFEHRVADDDVERVVGVHQACDIALFDTDATFIFDWKEHTARVGPLRRRHVRIDVQVDADDFPGDGAERERAIAGRAADIANPTPSESDPVRRCDFLNCKRASTVVSDPRICRPRGLEHHHPVPGVVAARRAEVLRVQPEERGKLICDHLRPHAQGSRGMNLGCREPQLHRQRDSSVRVERE